jgi:MFS family permease
VPRGRTRRPGRLARPHRADPRRCAGAAAGALVIAAAPTLAVAAVGLVLAVAGTAVLFPTLVGVVSRRVDESRRGRATPVVTTVSYLGFRCTWACGPTAWARCWPSRRWRSR